MESLGSVPASWLVGDLFVFSAAYTITQADIDAGGVDNTLR